MEYLEPFFGVLGGTSAAVLVLKFSCHLKRVKRMLAETDLQEYSLTRISTDKQIFQLIQGEVGEQLRVEIGGQEQCMSFHEFRTHYEEIRNGNEGMLQLEALLLSSMSDAKSNFCMTRLRLVFNALRDLVLFLLVHNALGAAEEIEKVEVPAFDEEKYQRKWPRCLTKQCSIPPPSSADYMCEVARSHLLWKTSKSISYFSN